MVLIRNNTACADWQDLSGTFAGLMDLYECNYIGVRRLIPVMPPARASLVSHVPGGLSLHLDVIERFRYTSELSLTYHFFRNAGMVAEPDVRIRVYHDARLAEVLSAHLRHRLGFNIGDDVNSRTYLRYRWHVNRFLYKWLSYCLHQGHHFGIVP
jgi:uncharacterized protein